MLERGTSGDKGVYMISNERFLELVATLPAIQRDLRDQANVAQLNAVMHNGPEILQIVAGPGSGKTTVLILRALKAVFVDDVLPENIVITTFTRKAARELRTRWLDWGTALWNALSAQHNLNHVDLNRCLIDTLDSVAEQVLTDFRPPGTVAPILAEGSASNLILKRSSFQAIYNAANEPVLKAYFATQSNGGQEPRNRGEALKAAKRIAERLIQDRVDLTRYAGAGAAQSLMAQMLIGYRAHALTSSVYDFPILEEQFLDRLQAGALDEWALEIKVVLIDEYQDTNPLQEAIYIALTRRANPALTIVGDDDQSMYRFRGGSVELFTQFAARWQRATHKATRRVDMIRNFRSLPEIVTFYNGHISGDAGFAAARIVPPKPLVVQSRATKSMPVLGMFRAGPDALARDLAGFLNDLRTTGKVAAGGTRTIELGKGGALGDAVFLSHSVAEVSYEAYDGIPKTSARFAGTFRSELESRGVEVFNPRGQALRNIPEVQQLLGLLLMAVDPDDALTPTVFPTNEQKYFLGLWRRQARDFIASKPKPNDKGGLEAFVGKWQQAARGHASAPFPRDWPVLELLFKLLTWFPAFQGEAERQVWLEAITRVIAGAGTVSPYGMQLIQNFLRANGTVVQQIRTRQGGTTANDVEESRKSFIRDALLAIAGDEVDVDEDIMPSVPRDRIQFMTIHQSKGLEFPLVIVDVGSAFKTNHRLQRFLRFPDGISNVVIAEDEVEPHLPSPLRVGRTARDRTFDDIARLYYVAFSRPQSVLLLVGCENCLRYGSGPQLDKSIIPHIALGWNRNGTWPWRQAYTGRKPPVRVDLPFELI